MDYANISKDTMGHIYAAYKSLSESPLAAGLKALIELRVSQINGCDYCCNLHTQEALKSGVSTRKIEGLSKFMTSAEFSDAEKEALKWAEALTRLDGNKKVQNTELSKYFTEREISDLMISIALMNTFNRLMLSVEAA